MEVQLSYSVECNAATARVTGFGRIDALSLHSVLNLHGVPPRSKLRLTILKLWMDDQSPDSILDLILNPSLEESASGHARHIGLEA